MKQLFMRTTIAVAALVLTACVAPPKPYDYTAFKAARPASLLIMPPINESPDVRGTYSVLAQSTMPLAEAGYYVLPVTLVDETFRENGLTSPTDIQAVDAAKLRSIFGADAAVYMTIKQYGTSYNVVSGDATVVLQAKIIDLRDGKLLWEGASWASTAEGQSNQGGLAGMLIKAVISQIVNQATEASHRVANTANVRLFTHARQNGVLPGPRLPEQAK
jgi:hypothetical protein